jgi:DNA-binding MarR family transcriptional regulator
VSDVTGTPKSVVAATDAVEATLTASRALLGVVARSLVGALQEVSIPQFRILVVLTSGGPTRVGTLAERMNALPSTFTRAIDRMVDGGWVERTTSPDSRREVLIRITPQGRAIVDEVTERRRAELSKILLRLSPEEQAAVQSGLETFARAAPEDSAEELIILGL